MKRLVWKQVARGCALVGAVLVLIGCQTTKAPSITVREVSVVEQTGQGAELKIDLVAQSENDFHLKIVEIGYRVQVEGIAEPFSLPDMAPIDAIPPASEGRRVIELKAAFPTGGLNILGRGYKVDGTVSYEPPGAWARAKRETGFPWPSVSFKAEGALE